MAENIRSPVTGPPDTDNTDPEDLDAAADRLEAALERIARHLDTARPPAELATRLDGLIERLREALSGSPGDGPPRDGGSLSGPARH
jgi:hypothetical protein